MRFILLLLALVLVAPVSAQEWPPHPWERTMFWFLPDSTRRECGVTPGAAIPNEPGFIPRTVVLLRPPSGRSLEYLTTVWHENALPRERMIFTFTAEEDGWHTFALYTVNQYGDPGCWADTLGSMFSRPPALKHTPVTIGWEDP